MERVLRAIFGPEWLWYPNDGSFQGKFDWVPRYLRVGPWSVGSCLFLPVLYGGTWMLRPTPLDLPVAIPQRLTFYFWVNCGMAVWGTSVLRTMVKEIGWWPFFSYTIWHWTLLTAYATATTVAAIAPGSIAGTFGVVAESLRFPAAAGNTITWFVWNFVLAPVIYKFGMYRPKDRAEFVKWLVSPLLIQVHLLNLPAVVLVIGCGGLDGGARPFNETDLWLGVADMILYSILYLFFLDRLGVHFYPVFSPRTQLSFLVYGLVPGLYVLCHYGWNDFINWMG